MGIKTIFLDRDGVVNKEKKYLFKIKDFEFITGIFSSCQYFNRLGYEIIIVTNQSGISRDYYSEGDYKIITNWMVEQFKDNNINILDVFHCPHSPEFDCNCRKPKPGMFIEAKNKHGIDMEKSWMIGDSERDIQAANLAGIKKTIMVRSGHKINESKSDAMYFLDSIYQANKIIT